MRTKSILSVILFNLLVLTAFAQTTVKVGYADIEYILSEMPETTNAQAELDEIMGKLTKTRDSIVKDYKVKLEDYQKNAATLVETAKKEKEADLLNIQNGIQGFDADIQTALNYKKNELLKPIYNRIAVLVEEVAKEKGYTHIINSEINGSSVLVYAEESTDISDLVIAKAKK